MSRARDKANSTVSNFASTGIDDNADANAITIDSGENVLIGTTSNSIYNTTTTGINLNPDGPTSFNRASGQAAMFNRTSTNGDTVQFRKDGTLVGSIGTDNFSQFFIGEGTTTGFRFDHSNNRIMAGATGSSNNLTDLGAATSRFKDLYLGGGVYLGGTGSANRLSDYETGTWTPVLTATTAPTYTEDSVFGATYVKIGAAVTVWFDLNMDITAAGSGQARISGLPFPPDHGSNQGYSALQLRNTTSINVANGTYLTGWGYGANSNIYIESNVTNTTSPSWNTGNNLRMTGFLHYQTTS